MYSIRNRVYPHLRRPWLCNQQLSIKKHPILTSCKYPCFQFCRTGTNLRTSQTLMPKSLMIGMMKLMVNGSLQWLTILNTRLVEEPVSKTFICLLLFRCLSVLAFLPSHLIVLTVRLFAQSLYIVHVNLYCLINLCWSTSVRVSWYLLI